MLQWTCAGTTTITRNFSVATTPLASSATSTLSANALVSVMSRSSPIREHSRYVVAFTPCHVLSAGFRRTAWCWRLAARISGQCSTGAFASSNRISWSCTPFPAAFSSSCWGLFIRGRSILTRITCRIWWCPPICLSLTRWLSGAPNSSSRSYIRPMPLESTGEHLKIATELFVFV